MSDEILRKLEEIERRLARLEEQKNIMGVEKTEVAEENELESEETSQVDDATITTKKIPFCECGRKLEDFSLCSKCKKHLCDNCFVSFRKKNYCSEHLQERLPITVQSFKALVCIANGISKESAIQNITRITRDELKEAIAFLKSKDYIDVSFFGKKSILDFGMQCITSWGQLLGGSDEMRRMDEDLRRYLNGY